MNPSERLGAPSEKRESRATELRREIAGAKERIAEIEDGSFVIEDASLVPIILTNIKERLAIAEENLLIAEGAKPNYEEQVKQLEQDIAQCIDQYAHRWEELTESGDEARILAFLGGIRRDALSYPGKSPYEAAKSHAESNLAQHEASWYRPQDERNILRAVKNDLEDTLRRSA